jgi:hypothetical protein
VKLPRGILTVKIRLPTYGKIENASTAFILEEVAVVDSSARVADRTMPIRSTTGK